MSLEELATRSLNDQIRREIRAEMARQGMSQMKLGEALGCAQNAVSRRLTGKVNFSLSEIEQIAEVLDVPVDQLMPRPRLRKKVS